MARCYWTGPEALPWLRNPEGEFVQRWFLPAQIVRGALRGVALLERLAQVGPVNAKTQLAIAIRTSDPVRARALLEQGVRGDAGGAIPPLADMLIKGEGGPADPKRAVSLLIQAASTPAVAMAQSLPRTHPREQLYLFAREPAGRARARPRRAGR